MDYATGWGWKGYRRIVKFLECRGIEKRRTRYVLKGLGETGHGLNVTFHRIIIIGSRVEFVFKDGLCI